MNTASMSQDEFRENLMAPLIKDDTFTRDEALSIIRAIIADKPEDMRGNAIAVMNWAIETRGRAAILDVIIELGTHRAIGVKPGTDGDLTLELTPGRG